MCLYVCVPVYMHMQRETIGGFNTIFKIVSLLHCWGIVISPCYKILANGDIYIYSMILYKLTVLYICTINYMYLNIYFIYTYIGHYWLGLYIFIDNTRNILVSMAIGIRETVNFLFTFHLAYFFSQQHYYKCNQLYFQILWQETRAEGSCFLTYAEVI